MDKNKLKQRLVGAVVLVALAVIIIPVIFDFQRDQEWRNAELEIPVPPERGFVTRVLPVDQMEQAAEAQVTAGKKALEPPAAESVPEAASPAPMSPPAASAIPPVSTSKPTVSATAAVPEAQAWVVQLGSFSSEKNAHELRDKLRAKGYTAYAERVGSSGKMMRVRVGPELTRARADSLRNKLERDMQLQGIVVKYP